MVSIDPNAEVMKHAVSGIDFSVPVAARYRIIELGERSIADLSRLSGPERSGIAEELATIIDPAVMVAVEAKESVVLTPSGPCNMIRYAIGIDIEAYRVGGARKVEAILA
jgi:hypothetical protein